MKKFIFICCSYLLLTLSFGFTAPDACITDTGKKFQILFNKNTGFTELSLIQAECDKKGIRLTYKKIEYNEEGKLQSLSFRVDCKDGFSGAASTDRLMENSLFGFFRDYTENAKSPFAVGAIEVE
jgi:hypothetical protein